MNAGERPARTAASIIFRAGKFEAGDRKTRNLLMPLPHERGARAYIERRYNTAVPDASPQPEKERPSKHHIYKLETGGILIIGAVILALILIRYWHHIAWGAR